VAADRGSLRHAGGGSPAIKPWRDQTRRAERWRPAADTRDEGTDAQVWGQKRWWGLPWDGFAF
jgi:hypothetical protein